MVSNLLYTLRALAKARIDYAIAGFVDVLAQAAVDAAEKQLGSNAQEHYRIPRTSVIRARNQLKSSLEALSLGMREAAAMRAASAPLVDDVSEDEDLISARYVHCVLCIGNKVSDMHWS